ncbi:MAG: clostri-philic family protein [Clostridium sp.]|nr:clostri-philic family protein [Clostridium sp.]
MKNKPGADNPMQKGKRRKKLHDEQNNVGDPQKQPSVFQNNKDNKFL